MHIFHDYGLWSPPQPVEGGLAYRQFRTCKVCALIDFRTSGYHHTGRYDIELADCNRTETLQALPADKSMHMRLLRIEDRVRAIEQHLVL